MVIATTLSVSMWTASANAADATSPDYFIGYWGVGAADECESRDTMSFYTTGAWAITNGGGNPVEALGVWALEADRVVLGFSELGMTSDVDAVEAVISDAEENRFTMVSPALPDGELTLYRCDG